MATKFYRDADGNYIGGFDENAQPSNGIEVPYPPNDVRQKWVNNDWAPLDPAIIAADDIAAINVILADPGNLLRGLIVVMKEEINKVRTSLLPLPARSLEEFIVLLQSKMR